MGLGDTGGELGVFTDTSSWSDMAGLGWRGYCEGELIPELYSLFLGGMAAAEMVAVSTVMSLILSMLSRTLECEVKCCPVRDHTNTGQLWCLSEPARPGHRVQVQGQW